MASAGGTGDAGGGTAGTGGGTADTGGGDDTGGTSGTRGTRHLGWHERLRQSRCLRGGEADASEFS